VISGEDTPDIRLRRSGPRSLCFRPVTIFEKFA
jgi:hypothetical protein